MNFTTLIPTCRNDGSPVDEAELREILDGLMIRFGGYTVEGTVQGTWIDAGKVYRDESLKVSVATDAERLSEAEQVIRDIGRRLGQEAMYFEVKYADGVRFLR